MSATGLWWPDPRGITIRREHDALTVTAERQTASGLTAKPAFPWCTRQGPVAILDAKGTTWLMIEDRAALEPQSLSALEIELEGRSFIPVVLEIKRIHFWHNVFSFEVLTDRGPRSFKASHTTWGRRLSEVTPRGELILTSTDGIRYRIPEPRKLPARILVQLEPLL